MSDLADAGEQIERLLTALGTAGPLARERAEDLVRVVADLYGAGLERLLDIAFEAGALDDSLLDQIAADELVAGLLAVHGLHPQPVEERVRRALVGFSGVEVAEITATGEVWLSGLSGGCHGTPVVSQEVVDAINAAAPEILSVQAVEPVPEPAVIPLESLSLRLRATS